MPFEHRGADPIPVETLQRLDGITCLSKWRRYHDFGTGFEGKYRRDGIHAYCLEEAGATSIFSDGSFQQIVDSD